MKPKKIGSMMRIVEIAWLAVAAMSLVEVFMRWENDRDKALMFGGFFLLAAFMYFFRKKQRFKYIRRNQDQD